MQAAVCREFGAPLSIETVKLAKPAANEVHVKLAACAICHSDLTFMDGGWGGQLPQIFGHEAAGIIIDVGANVHDAKVGDRVIATLIRSCGHCRTCESGEPYICPAPFASDEDVSLQDVSGNKIIKGLKTGGFAEEIVVDQSQVVTIPDTIPLDVACLLSCGVITGLGAVTNTANVPFGASVVVIGCGGVGLNSIQGATLVGANPIIGVDLADAKLDAAKTFGATHSLNPTKTNLCDEILELTNGSGADYVFVAAGSPKAFEQGLELLSLSGTLVIVGMPPTGETISVEVGNLAAAGQRILGSKMGSTRLRVDIPKLVSLYEQGRLKLDELVTGRYPLHQINEAIEEVRSNKALRNIVTFK